MPTKEELHKKAMDDHIAKVVAEWPPPTPEMVRRVTLLLMGKDAGSTYVPERPEVIATRKAQESLAKVRREFKEAMAGCHGCGLSRKAHTYQNGYAMGFHEFEELSPDGAIKVAQAYKKKIAAAEKVLEKAREK